MICVIEDHKLVALRWPPTRRSSLIAECLVSTRQAGRPIAISNGRITSKRIAETRDGD